MRVFITGATGYIGSAVTKELTAHGHEVVGIARSDTAKQRLAELGASAFDGSLEDLGSLSRGAQSADAVIHLAFIHNFADFAAGAKYQAVGDFALPYRDVADAIGKILNVPAAGVPADKALEHFGFLGAIVGADSPASSVVTQAALGWKPTHPALLEDIATGYATAFGK
jgi:nucleoside-diphosphate-sugar epimerase